METDLNKYWPKKFDLYALLKAEMTLEWQDVPMKNKTKFIIQKMKQIFSKRTFPDFFPKICDKNRSTVVLLYY